MKTYARDLVLLFTLFLACPTGHAAEQDNWYLANEWSRTQSAGVFHYVDQNTASERIYVARADSTAEIYVYEMNGTFERKFPIGNSDYYAYDLALDANGTIFVAEKYAVACLENDGTFKWRLGKNASISSSGSGGSGDGEFNQALGIAIHPSSGELFVADRSNHRIQVLDKNGSFIRKFGLNGTAPGQLKEPHDLVFLPDGTLVVGDNNYLHYFQTDGTFIKRVNTSAATKYVSVGQDGTLFCNGKLRDQDGNVMASGPFGSVNVRTCLTPEGDLIQSGSDKLRIWKRAYRTKGLPVRNVIPQPAVRAITQRAGTNIIDLDFEIIDPDDANATVGILAAQDGAFDDTSKWILPQTWVDGTGSKIGNPIATNQVHRVSWNVKPDWPDSTGTLKFEIICHDARRTAPVDLHFLTLPLPDGNLTISRSPLKDSDFESYAKFLLTMGESGLSIDSNGSIVKSGSPPPNGSTQYVFTNCGATGHQGPTWTEVNASYVGTNLEGQVGMSTQGIQEWTVPVTGTYVIEAMGAQGGAIPPSSVALPGFGAYARGVLNLPQGKKVKILVGQMGIYGSGSHGSGGGGGSFVVDLNGSPLIIAGGGGGAGGSPGQSGSDQDFGGSVGNFSGGQNGNGGQSEHPSRRGGGGLISDGESSGGSSFINGGQGSNGYSKPGGFGGGGSGGVDHPGGGGGYSGGAASSAGAGGGGSYNVDVNGTRLAGTNSGHGRVLITHLPSGGNVTRTLNQLVTNTSGISGIGRMMMIQALGTGFRYATPEEVQKASEAATAGGVNQWTANRPIQPRNLPNKVNEYGFDTGDHGNRAWWIVQE